MLTVLRQGAATWIVKKVEFASAPVVSVALCAVMRASVPWLWLIQTTRWRRFLGSVTATTGQSLHYYLEISHRIFTCREAFENYCVNVQTDLSDESDESEAESDNEHETEGSTLFEAVSMMNI